MKIGVVSDTHSQPVPQQLLDDFKSVDLIVHAGDFCSLDDLLVFEKIKNVRAVYGNMDDAYVCKKLPAQDIFEFDGLNFGLCHGEGPPRLVLGFVAERFAGENLDVVIFGHSHQVCNEIKNGILYFNPGSPNDYIVAPYCSYGIIEIKKGKAKGTIIKLKS